MKIKREYLLAVSALLLVIAFVSVWGSVNKTPDTINVNNDETESVISSLSEGSKASLSSSESESTPVSEEINKALTESKETAVSQSENEDVSKAETNESLPDNEEITSQPEITETEFINGAWISYLSLASNSEEEFKINFSNLVNKAKEKGITDLFVHVRPFMDSMYKSDLFPISHLITGEQGDDINFDALEYMIDVTHSMGMKFHAWINPLRIKTVSTPKFLSEDNVYNKYIESDPYFFIETESTTVLNPSYSFVRELVSEGIREIVAKYNVDGIHFDDYFYPSDYDINTDSAYSLYVENTENPLSENEWMCANINSLIALCYNAVKSERSDVLFGISPQGNMDNNMKIGADTALWCKTEGYIDYICPQLYWSYENPALTFTDALNRWMNLEKHGKLKIYIGLALYKVGTESDSGTWNEGVGMIYRQQEDSEKAGADGTILYEIGQFDKLT